MGYQRYELDVRLREIEPAIWRRVDIGGDASLAEVHMALQVAMGWQSSHLHQFLVGKKQYGMVDVDGAEDMEREDEREYRLQDVGSAARRWSTTTTSAMAGSTRSRSRTSRR